MLYCLPRASTPHVSHNLFRPPNTLFLTLLSSRSAQHDTSFLLISNCMIKMLDATRNIALVFSTDTSASVQRRHPPVNPRMPLIPPSKRQTFSPSQTIPYHSTTHTLAPLYDTLRPACPRSSAPTTLSPRPPGFFLFGREVW